MILNSFRCLLRVKGKRKMPQKHLNVQLKCFKKVQRPETEISDWYR